MDLRKLSELLTFGMSLFMALSVWGTMSGLGIPNPQSIMIALYFGFLLYRVESIHDTVKEK